jgi:hypothetical protein
MATHGHGKKRQHAEKDEKESPHLVRNSVTSPVLVRHLIILINVPIRVPVYPCTVPGYGCICVYTNCTEEVDLYCRNTNGVTIYNLTGTDTGHRLYHTGTYPSMRTNNCK